MAFEDKVKSFGMTNMLIEADLEQIEKRFNVVLNEKIKNQKSKNRNNRNRKFILSSIRGEFKKRGW